jgi:hypothetical protein
VSAGTPANVTMGPGTLFIAPLGSAEPTDLATAWPVAWVQMGYTEDGSTFGYNVTVDEVYVAEELDPIRNVPSKRVLTVDFKAAEITATNLKRAFNGGTVVVGTGIVTFSPPALGAEVRSMIGWQSTDGLERWVYRQAIQVASVAMDRKKAPAKATINMSFKLETVVGLPPFKAILDSSRA